MPENSAKQLTAIISQRMLGIFDLPEGFPDIRFDWVTEEDLRERIRVEASAPGNWPLTGNRILSQVSLKAEIHKYAPHQLSTGTLTGRLAMGNHSFPVTYHFPGPFQFTIQLARVPMEHLINPVAPDADLFHWLPALALRDAHFAFSPHSGQFTLQAKSDDAWTVPVGRNGISLRQLQLNLERKSTLSGVGGRIEGWALLGGQELCLSAPVDKPSVLIAHGKGFNLPAVIDALCDEAPLTGKSLPVKPLLDASIQVNLADRSFSAQGSPPDAGPTRAKVYRHHGRWGFVAMPEMLRSWRLSEMAPFLRPLDRVDITKLNLVVTSFNQVPWDVPGLNHDLTARLRKGTNLVIPTRLAGLPEFDLLARLYGSADTTVTLVGNLNPEQLTVRGKLPSLEMAAGIDFVEPLMTLTQSSSGQTELEIEGSIHFQAGETTLAMSGRLQIQGQHGNLNATLDEPWNQPFGVKGLVVNRLNLTAAVAENAVPEFAIAGRAALLGKPGSVRIAQTPPLNDEVRLEFDQISAPELFQTVLGNPAVKIRPEVRAALDSGFHDVLLTFSPSGNTLQSGFRLLGQNGHFSGGINPDSGLEATGEMDAIRRQRISGGRHIVELTKPSGDSKFQRDGPSLQLRLGDPKEPGIQFAGICTLFAEFSAPVQASLTKKGAKFRFEYDADHVGFDLECVATEDDFTAVGDFGLQIQTQLLLREPKSGAVLGRVNVDAPFHGKLTLQISDEAFEAGLSGSLLWQNLKLEAPKLLLRETPVHFAEFAQSIIAELRPHAFAMFKSAFADAEAFFAARQDGHLIAGQAVGLDAVNLACGMGMTFNPNATQMAYALRDLGYSTHEIAAVLKQVARLSPEAAAKQLHAAQCSSNQIASALRAAYDATPEVIAQSLRAIGFGYHPIADALRLGGGFNPTEATRALRAASFDAVDIAQGLREHFHVPASEVAHAFRAASIQSKEALEALPPAFEINREETELLLINAGYSPREVRNASEKSGRFLNVFG